MKNKICPHCEKEFKPRKSRDKFCCKECYYEHRKTGVYPKVFWTEQMRKEQSARYSGDKNPMFGKKSWNAGLKMPNMSGENHPNWKGGWVQDGYKFIIVDGRTVAEHRHMMEQYLGRELDRYNEVVHHKNGDRLDNRLENLEVLTRSEHMKVHREDIIG